MTRLEWTEPAVADLENIQDYIARDSVEYADAVVERFIVAGRQRCRFLQWCMAQETLPR